MNNPLFEFYNTIRYRVTISDIVGAKVKLQRKSSEYIGLCPFHKEKTPSFTVNNAKRFYHCFGCNAHGDVIKFLSEVNGLSYNEAAKHIAQNYGISLPKIWANNDGRSAVENDHMLNILRLATEFFHSNMNQEIYSYLETRGIDKDLASKLQLGFASDYGALEKFFANHSVKREDLIKVGLMSVKSTKSTAVEIFNHRVIFPIKDIYNKIVGFGGRAIKNNAKAKYINSPETVLFNKSQILYGENVARSAIYKKQYAILVEGYFDVVSLHKEGFLEAVATLGTAVTNDHINHLMQISKEIIVCLDSDNAGMLASIKIIKMVLPIIKPEKIVSFVILPDNTDPDSIIQSQGADMFQQHLNNRISMSEMIWNIEFYNKEFKTAESISMLEHKLNTYCSEVKDYNLSKNYRQFFKNQIWERIRNNKNHVNTGSGKQIASSSAINSPLLQYNESEILEYAFCAFLIIFPEFRTNDEEYQYYFETLDFQNKELSEFCSWIFRLDSKIKLHDLVKGTRFNEIFLILLEFKYYFLGISTDNCSNELLWRILNIKRQLMLMKKEFHTLLSSNTDQAKILAYKSEMVSAAEELRRLQDEIND